MPDAKQWEEAPRTEMKRLERLGVFSAPYPLPYEAKKKWSVGALEGDAGGPGVPSTIWCGLL